jgi:hypothetical protein
MKRRRFVFGTGVAALAALIIVGYLVLLLTSPPEFPYPKIFNAIKEGMTESDVQAVFDDLANDSANGAGASKVLYGHLRPKVVDGYLVRTNATSQAFWATKT